MQKRTEGFVHRWWVRSSLGGILVAILIAAPSVGLANEPLGDTALDAIFAVQAFPDRLCVGDGEGGFTCSDVSPDTDWTFDVALGFVNADDKLDAVLAVGNQSPDRVCLGDGAGGFSCSDISATAASTLGVDLGFIDGDANLDAVFAIGAFPGTSRVCLGDGLGGFSCADTLPGDFIADATLGLIDGDAHLDVILASSNPGADTPNRICFGDGSGGFSCSDLGGPVEATYEAALGFVDGDTNLDVVFANNFPRPRVCLGDGLGGFPTCFEIDNLDNFYRGVALGFVDGDTHLDAVFARSVSNPNRVCLGDGLGGFSCSDVSADTNSSEGVALGLIDGDAHLDAVFANSPTDPDRVCFGDGTGGFTSCADANVVFANYPTLPDQATLGDSGPNASVAVALGEIVDRGIFADGFESGDTSAWTVTVP